MLNKDSLEKAKRNKRYLIGKTLYTKQFMPSFPAEYAVCVFCWAQFSGFEEDLQYGFYEQESESWVCSHCFDMFAKEFRWITKQSDDSMEFIPYDKDYFDE